MAQGRIKNNYFTVPDRRPPKSKDKGEIEDILGKYGSKFPFLHTADICGARIQLRTNSRHVSDYWILNWYPSHNQNPDGRIYVVNGIEGYEPRLFYNLEKRRILIVNSEYYGAVKSAGALGLAGVILEETGGYPIHGACLGIDKNGTTEGVIIIAPTGTGKTSQLHEMLYNLPRTKVHSDDYVFVSFENEIVVRATENWLYIRSDMAEQHPTFINLFHDMEMENVVEHKDVCPQIGGGSTKRRHGPCYRETLHGDKVCVFDEGADRCYWAYGNSRVMFDRAKFPMMVKGKDGSLYEVPKGRKGVVDEVPLKYVFLLTRDDHTPPVTRLDTTEGVATLKEGKYTIRPGAGPPEKWGKIGYESFFDPYPPELNARRQEEFYTRLFDSGVTCYLLNTGTYKRMNIPVHRTHMYLRHILEI
jgi:ATP-dependent phosphoenolpyruvate carboxykinase